MIHGVLRHAAEMGFDRLPLPIAATTQETFLAHGGHLWQLEPWLPGKADFVENPSDRRLDAAMRSLAQFHRAVATYPGANAGTTADSIADSNPATHGMGASPAVVQRRDHLARLLVGEAREIEASIDERYWPELAALGRDILEAFRRLAPTLLPLLEEAARYEVPRQPCIRDIWHDHVLFDGDEVAGLIDFGAMQFDNPATDFARLLGSLAENDARQWRTGIASYESLRELSGLERSLVHVLDRGSILMSGLNWLDWVFRQGRVFENRRGVTSRCEMIRRRIVGLSSLADPPWKA
jgi:Ser/Thr protein kinase RdoA (MazF antagonist)